MKMKDMLCYTCGMEFEDEVMDINVCPHCDGEDVIDMETALQEEGLI